MTEETRVYTVSELNIELKNVLERTFYQQIVLEAEIQSYKESGPNAYIKLTDGNDTISCNIFNVRKKVLVNSLSVGDIIVVMGTVNVYEKNASISINAQTVLKKEKTLGTYLENLEKLKKELESLGYFKPKYKKLDKHIQYLGIVTAKTGAAIEDIKKTIENRNNNIHIYLYNAKVQGENAHLEIKEGIEFLNKIEEIQVIIVSRGGGSVEDLKAFNTKEVVEAIHNSKKYVVSAVGHEVDNPLSDLAADLAASTPTQAIERIIFERSKELEKIDELYNKICQNLKYKYNIYKSKIDLLSSKLEQYTPVNEYKRKLESFDRLSEDLMKTYERYYKFKYRRIQDLFLEIEKYSINDILNRGFTYVLDKDQKLIKNINDIKKDDLVEIIFKDFKAYSKVVNVDEKN